MWALTTHVFAYSCMCVCHVTQLVSEEEAFILMLNIKLVRRILSVTKINKESCYMLNIVLLFLPIFHHELAYRQE